MGGTGMHFESIAGRLCFCFACLVYDVCVCGEQGSCYAGRWVEDAEIVG